MWKKLMVVVKKKEVLREQAIWIVKNLRSPREGG